MQSGFYVNQQNINTLFKPGTNTVGADGGFRIGGQDIQYDQKGISTSSVPRTFFTKMNLDLNTYFKDKNALPTITTSDITISETGSTPQFPSIVGYNTLYITDGSGTCMFDTDITISKIFLVGGGGQATTNTPASVTKIGSGGRINETSSTISLLANTPFSVKVGSSGEKTYVRINTLLTEAFPGGQTSTSATQGTLFNSNQLYYGGSGGTTNAPLGGGGGGGGGGNINSSGSAGYNSAGISPTLTGGLGGAGGAAGVNGVGGRNSLYGGGGGGGGGSQGFISGVQNAFGGRGGSGGNGTSNTGSGTDGGAGVSSANNNNTQIYGGGGGGGSGGKNTGGGGGRGGHNGVVYGIGGRGGSGIVIILYNYL